MFRNKSFAPCEKREKGVSWFLAQSNEEEKKKHK